MNNSYLHCKFCCQDKSLDYYLDLLFKIEKAREILGLDSEVYESLIKLEDWVEKKIKSYEHELTS